MLGAPTLALKPSFPFPKLGNRTMMMNVTASVVHLTDRKKKSLYEVLRVKQNASQVEIKTAYRTLAKLYHPDATSRFINSDGQDFIQIRNAYDTLSDPDARAVYDLNLNVKNSNSHRWNTSTYHQGRFYTTTRWETDQCW